MRKQFVRTLIDIAKKDKKVVLLSADVGFSVLESFQQEFPDRFINTGVQESNMISVAAGLALTGKKVFVYTFASFLVMRAFEQIKIDVAYQDLNVTLVGIGGGLVYGKAGVTHQAITDIALMRSLPSMTVLCPSDPYSAKNLTNEAYLCDGPTYLRMSKQGEPVIYDKGSIKIGQAKVIHKGKDVAILSIGNMTLSAIEISSRLQKKGLSVKLLDMLSVKPLDVKAVLDCAKTCKSLYTLEEHNIIGGLGSAVAETLSENNCCVKFKRLGINDKFVRTCGSQDFIRKQLHIDIESVVDLISKEIEQNDKERIK